MTTTQILTIAPAPKFAGMREWDCERCGRQEVKPVFLSDGRAYGSGCAAIMLGRPQSSGRKIIDEAAAIERRAAEIAEMVAERVARYTQALADFHAGIMDTPALTSARTTYHRSGGSKVLGTFPAWMGRVAETGDLS